jgi:hypothetical protein
MFRQTRRSGSNACALQAVLIACQCLDDLTFVSGKARRGDGTPVDGERRRRKPKSQRPFGLRRQHATCGSGPARRGFRPGGPAYKSNTDNTTRTWMCLAERSAFPAWAKFTEADRITGRGLFSIIRSSTATQRQSRECKTGCSKRFFSTSC